jgi:hypothetical protein
VIHLALDVGIVWTIAWLPLCGDRDFFRINVL